MGATNPAYWALEARRRMHECGTTEQTLARAVVLSHRHAAGNPLARYPRQYTVAEVLESPSVCDPLHLLQICAVSDGAAAVILGSEEQARRLGGRRPQIAGSAIATGLFGDPAARIPTVATCARPGVPRTSEVFGAVAARSAARRRRSRGRRFPGDCRQFGLARTRLARVAWICRAGRADRMLEHDDLPWVASYRSIPAGVSCHSGKLRRRRVCCRCASWCGNCAGRRALARWPTPRSALRPCSDSARTRPPVSSRSRSRRLRGGFTMASLDALIIGAGFAGVRALHMAREQGLTALVLEQPPVWAASGTTTAIPARAATSKATTTPTASPSP